MPKSFKNIIRAKLEKLPDSELMELLNHGAKEHIKDWRNFGNNETKILAEIAHKRGLIS